MRLVLSCEHGGNLIPPELAERFRGRETLLASHRGWDPGALVLAAELHHALGAPLHAATLSRLVVDLNRSPDHPGVLSELTRSLPARERRQLLARHHAPHRRELERQVRRLSVRGAVVVHVGVHSFTPVLDGRRRDMDLGLLFDPRRPLERAFCERWRRELARERPDMRVAFNRPYRGSSDGLTTTLRGRLPPERYLGVELELNQALLGGRQAAWRGLRAAIRRSLDRCLALDELEQSR